MKTQKSFTKRLRRTKSGKIVGRKPGQGHYNAKESGECGLNKRRKVQWQFAKRVADKYLGGAR